MSRDKFSTASPVRQGQVAGRKLYDMGEGGVQFISTQRPGFTPTPNYVIDMYLPLIGVRALGVYLVYSRLAMGGEVRKNSHEALARSMRLGERSLREINDALEACGLVTVRRPKGDERLRHYATTIEGHDPPRTIAP